MADILRELIRVGVALGFAAGAMTFIMRAEWFDVLRWGPPRGTVLCVYIAWSIAAGLVGWMLAATMTSRNVWGTTREWLRSR